MQDTVEIVLADDHFLIRDGIRALLEEEKDLVIIAEASNGKEAVEIVHQKNPDLLIIDIRMPEMNGIDAIELLNKQGTTTKSIILSMHDSEEYILKALAAGANGYLLKDTGKVEFIKAIRTVQQGGKYFSGDISNVLVNNLLNSNKTPNEKSTKVNTNETPFDLTSKELQILELILSGFTNKQISEKLENSKRTIETHRFNLMRKMDVKNLIDLSKKAQKYNLIEL
ncbi:MAG: response regulator transcription factor [Cellulophaga sp.]|nr:response regulator transcription factor [Cellulophaga sp.]